MIYVFKIIDQDIIKIGYTKNRSTKDRLKSCNTHNPYKLEVLLFIDGSQEKERNIHKQLSDYRISGEWFYYKGDVLTFVNSNKVYHVESDNRPVTRKFTYKQDTIRKPRPNDLIREAVFRQYKEGKTSRELALLYNKTPKSIQKMVEYAGITKRNEVGSGKYSKPKGYHIANQARRRARDKYKTGHITIEQLSEVYSIYPPKKPRSGYIY